MAKTKKNIADLAIRLMPSSSKPGRDGLFAYRCLFPRLGTAGMLVLGRNAEEAAKALESYLFNELDGEISAEQED